MSRWCSGPIDTSSKIPRARLTMGNRVGAPCSTG
jgi:hypothetical protein